MWSSLLRTTFTISTFSLFTAINIIGASGDVTNHNEQTVVVQTIFSGPNCCVGITGDVNVDGDDANILDLTYLVDFIFRGGPSSPCEFEADVNTDFDPENILDLTFLVDYIFRGGPPPDLCLD